MPYVTTYVTPKEMHEIEHFCEVMHISSYQLAKEAVLERVRSQKK
jgi:hypothetical protein